MDRQLFGTDGIRGRGGEYPLNIAGAVQIGKAVGVQFAHPGERIIIGCDTRESSPMLVAAVSAGLLSGGVDVEIVGIIPTPGLIYLTKQTQAKAGIMITASHNPYPDNGIKVFTSNGDKLSDEQEAALNALIVANIPDRGFGRQLTGIQDTQSYEASLVAAAEGKNFSGLKVVIDTANGATVGIAARVFKRLGATVTPLFSQPDGRNINERCGATHTEALQEAVVKQRADIGLAFDGDGDRVVFVDERGRIGGGSPITSGDPALYLLAVMGGHKGVVITAMSNMNLEKALIQKGILVYRSAVGDRYVWEGLRKTGYELGGEQSGHVIFPKHASSGDGIFTAVQVVRYMLASGKSLATWYDELPLLPQKLLGVPVQDKKLLNHPSVQAFIAEQTAELGGEGRLNVRTSGTEPIVRVMVEAADAEVRAARIAAALQQKIATAGAAT